MRASQQECWCILESGLSGNSAKQVAKDTLIGAGTGAAFGAAAGAAGYGVSKAVNVMKSTAAVEASNATAKVGGKTIQNVSDLSSNQLEALIKYTGDDYANINNSLRGIESLKPDNRATVETMKSVLNNASLTEDMILYRGTSTEALGLLQNLPTDELVGKTFIEQGFMSTSKSSLIAEDFSGNMKMTIEASQGAQALDISSISQYSTEAEILFNAEQEMLITAAEIKDGILHITTIIK